MVEEGEPFSQEELDEMMAVAVDGQTNLIPYEYYLNQLMVKLNFLINFVLLWFKIIGYSMNQMNQFIN